MGEHAYRSARKPNPVTGMNCPFNGISLIRFDPEDTPSAVVNDVAQAGDAVVVVSTQFGPLSIRGNVIPHAQDVVVRDGGIGIIELSQ